MKTITTLQVTLPLPPARLSPNRRPVSRVGRIIAAREIRSCRGIARLAVLQVAQAAHGLPWPVAKLETEWFLPRRRDGDNLLGWFKAYRDGLADAGVVSNDRFFVEVPPTQHSIRFGHKIVVTISRVDTA